MNTAELIRPLAARRRAASLSDAGHNVPVIFLAGPWLLLALAAAILAPPYRLMRHPRSVRARRASSSDRAARLVPVRSTRMAS